MQCAESILNFPVYETRATEKFLSGKFQRIIKQRSDINSRILILPPNNKMEQFIGNVDSSKMYDWDESRYLLDDEEDNPSEESFSYPHEIKVSSSMDTDNDFGKFAELQWSNTSASASPYTKNGKSYELKEVVRDYVLPFLPGKTLFRFTSVAKDWDQWIRSPFLAHQQSYQFKSTSGFFYQGKYNEWEITFISLSEASYGIPKPPLAFLPEPVNIRSSCNGLLLSEGRNENNTYYICNPTTKEWKLLPKPKYYHGSEPAVVLAFEPSVFNMGAHYHVICAVPLIDQPLVFFEVYSSATGSWTVSNTICEQLGDPGFTDNHIFMNGIAYWETSAGKVLAFDMKNELYEVMSLPSDGPQSGVLSQMQDELCYIGILNNGGSEYSLKIYGGMGFSLKLKIDVQLEAQSDDVHGYRVLPYADGDAVMILVGDSIYSCSMKKQSVELICTGVDSWAAANRYLPYVNSLVQVA